MNLKLDTWTLTEEGFDPSDKLKNESAFYMGNGLIGLIGGFEENYSNETNQGTYVKGFFQNDSVENQKLLRLPDCSKIHVMIDTESVNLSQSEIKSYRRVLNIHEGFVERNCHIVTAENHEIELNVLGFLSLDNPEIVAFKYSVRSVNFAGKISFTSVIDGSFMNENPEWNVLQSQTQQEHAHLWVQTHKAKIQVCQAMTFEFFKNSTIIKTNATKIEKQKVAGFSFGTDVKIGERLSTHKFVGVSSSGSSVFGELTAQACAKALEARSIGWDRLFEQNRQSWIEYWNKRSNSDKQSANWETYRTLYPEFKK
jgi:maltose phosphorylase